jgi:hypothetical protein
VNREENGAIIPGIIWSCMLPNPYLKPQLLMESSVTVNDINHQKQQESVAAEIEQQNRQTKQHS